MGQETGQSGCAVKVEIDQQVSGGRQSSALLVQLSSSASSANSSSPELPAAMGMDLHREHLQEPAALWRMDGTGQVSRVPGARPGQGFHLPLRLLPPTLSPSLALLQIV